MTKLNRVTGKIFGETASPIDDPILGPAIGQFGSAKAGTYIGTDDIATIQSLPAWSNGWIDAVTPTNQYPALPERTGVDKVLSYQQNYILQRGVPEWDVNTDYYVNCFCSYNGSIYRSIADDNTGHQPDDENYWELYGAIDDYANQSLTNLTALGNARLQFAPFAINQGTVLNGENNTLTYSGSIITCAPCTITTTDGKTLKDANSATYDVTNETDGSYLIFKNYADGALSLASSLWISKTNGKSWTQPVLRANGTMGGSSFAVKANVERSSHYAWYAMDGVTTGTNGWFSNEAAAGVWYSFYNPIPLNVTELKFKNYPSGGGYIYATTSGRVQISDDGVTWTNIKSYTNSITASGGVWSIDLSDNINYSKYYRVYSDTNYNADGWIINELTITATEQVNNWLDISTVPANLYIGGILNNNLVYIGDCTISGGVITAISNTNFNSSQSSEWVKKTVLIHNATAINTYEYDLSSYIPKGCSDAEVVLNYFIDETSTNPAKLFIYSSICQPAKFTSYYATVTSDVDARIQAGSITLPIGIDRKLYLKITDKAPNQGCYVELRAFRRIGVL